MFQQNYFQTCIQQKFRSLNKIIFSVYTYYKFILHLFYTLNLFTHLFIFRL